MESEKIEGSTQAASNDKIDAPRDSSPHATLGFLPETVAMPIDELHPLFTREIQGTRRGCYPKVLTSVREIGLIEPIVIVEKEGRYFIKDGFLRWQACKELGHETIECLVGTDLDAYTYNKRVNNLAPIQAHMMIDRAVKNGVDPDRIAAALNVSRDWVTKMENLLVGVAPRVIQKLKKRVVSATFFEELKKVKHDRQVEILELVEAADDFSPKYARAMVLATPASQRLKMDSKYKKIDDRAREEMAGKLRAMELEFRKASETFRDNVFNLVKLSGYIKLLLRNGAVKEFLGQQYPDVLVEFEKIGNDPSLNM